MIQCRMTPSPQHPVIIFDYDGVIADSLEICLAEFNHICTEMGLDRLNSRDAFLQLSEGKALRRLFWAGLPLWRLKRMLRRFRPRLEAAARSVKPFDGMPELLGELAQRLPVYIVTSNASDTIHWFLETHAVEGVRGVIGADQEVRKAKKIKRVMREHPERTPYYVGDTKGDMIAARQAGAAPVAVTWGWHGRDKVLEGCPEHVVESPAELRALFLGE